MAVKTFTSEILTSSDTNTYLANSGLVYVKSQTVGTAVSSVTVSDAFSATYDSYKILYTGGVGSTATALTLKMGATTAGYYSQLIYAQYSGSTVLANVPDNNAAVWSYVGAGSTSFARLEIEINNPFTAHRTVIKGSYVDTGLSGNFAGYLNNTTSYTAFTLAPTSGTLTGGTITVYGYRQA